MLERYVIYSAGLDKNGCEALNTAFWAQIKEIGTPIIEEFSNDEVKVHFLFPRNQYDHGKKKLYISGDYHGFTSTNNERQEMGRIAETDIMYRSDKIPKDSVVIYDYFQAPPPYQNKNRPEISGPSEALPDSFYDIEPIPAVEEDPVLQKFKLRDAYSKHSDYVGTLFCANVDNDLSRVRLMRNTNWEQLLAEDGKHLGFLKNLSHQATYLCDMNDRLVEDKNAADKYLDTILNSKEHTRSVSVFVPPGNQVDKLVIVHDGFAYMSTGTVEYLDLLIEKGLIPKNTAIICITPLYGLLEKYKRQSPEEFAEAEDFRQIEYGTKIDNYVTFIDIMLKQLGYYVPAKNITLIGSSKSATASLYMVLEHADKFGNTIAQAPSYVNRIILFPAVAKRKLAQAEGKAEDLTSRIQLSCGKFDSLDHAQNLNLANTQELATVLGSDNQPISIHSGNYGHTICCWSQELTEILPILYRQQQALVSESRLLEEYEQSAQLPELSSTARLAKNLKIKPSIQQSIEDNLQDEKKKESTNKLNPPENETLALQLSSDSNSTHKTILPFIPKPPA